jgi:1-pyrroline-5-carboxylate dehydrogenase
MFNPPPELHTRYDEALAKIKAGLGQEHAMLIGNKDVFADEKYQDFSPIDTGMVLASLQKGNEKHAHQALDAARKAFPVWSRTPWQERVRLLRKAASLIEERLFALSAALSLEVGKNRLEALGDVQETADLINYACDQMEKNNGYIVEMDKDPLVGYDASNVSVLKPYGVWLVISPFNFPVALTGGPAGAALVTGNTVIVKPASDTAWVVRMLAECFVDAGLPEGVFNYVTGPGRTLGQALITCAVDGVTFTGSFDVGSKIFRDFANCNWVRPIVLELGGKNATIVSRHADLERAALGIVRSAFGLQGQKCSAASRVFVEEPVYDELVKLVKELTEKLTIGDPTDRSVYLGPVINEGAYKEFQAYAQEALDGGGKFLTGGKVKTGEAFDKGYFCEPTLITDLPYHNRLWKHEMFLPITTIGKVKNLKEAMGYANDVTYGLTAGFYGSDEEAKWFFDNIEAGVAYANRPQGATTGAWPGYQPFGGWKASGSSGKNAGGHYYLPLYMHEQVHTVVK